VVTGAGVVTTGPHTASFLNVQNFLQNYLHLYSALVLVGMGVNVAGVVSRHYRSRYTASFSTVQHFLRNYWDVYLVLLLEEEGCGKSKSYSHWSKMFSFFLECAKVPATLFEFVHYSITKRGGVTMAEMVTTL
jgi:hypothetical protein